MDIEKMVPKTVYVLFYLNSKEVESLYHPTGEQKVELFEDKDELIKFINWRIVVKSITRINSVGQVKHYVPTFFNGFLALEEI